jgi:hypothetical protein
MDKRKAQEMGHSTSLAHWKVLLKGYLINSAWTMGHWMVKNSVPMMAHMMGSHSLLTSQLLAIPVPVTPPPMINTSVSIILFLVI